MIIDITENKREVIAQAISPFYDPKGPMAEASDGEMYHLHIEGLPGASFPCVLDGEGNAYEIHTVKDGKAWFTRYLHSRKGIKGVWFGPICGPSQWYIELKGK